MTPCLLRVPRLDVSAVLSGRPIPRLDISAVLSGRPILLWFL